MGGAILVTGAGGNVGSAVVDALRRLDVDVRAGDRTTAGGEATDVESVALDFLDDSSFPAALEGVTSVFLVRPPAIARVGPTLNRFLDVAAESGVEHVVFSSVAGADTTTIVPHHRVERHLQASEMEWTMLRPGFFTQNLGTAYRRDIRDRDRIYVPAGTGRVAFIDTRDIGEVAAVTLADRSHRMRAYHLTGPEAVTFEQVAEELTDVLGRSIRYEPASIPGYLRHLRSSGMGLPQTVVQTILHAGLRRGDAEEATDTVERILGRPPRTVRGYVEDHAPLWT